MRNLILFLLLIIPFTFIVSTSFSENTKSIQKESTGFSNIPWGISPNELVNKYLNKTGEDNPVDNVYLIDYDGGYKQTFFQLFKEFGLKAELTRGDFKSYTHESDERKDEYIFYNDKLLSVDVQPRAYEDDLKIVFWNKTIGILKKKYSIINKREKKDKLFIGCIKLPDKVQIDVTLYDYSFKKDSDTMIVIFGLVPDDTAKNKRNLKLYHDNQIFMEPSDPQYNEIGLIVLYLSPQIIQEYSQTKKGLLKKKDSKLENDL